MTRDYAFATDDILPPPPEGAIPVLHDREYRVESYFLTQGLLLIQGGLRDQKPPGLFIPEDPRPLTIHHMTIEMEVAIPSMEIVDVRTNFPSHPQPSCVDIIDHYDKLVGLSIARGFTHKVRELFGGPRGCSHTTMLLQAMAPIAMQSFKSMEIEHARQNDLPSPLSQGGEGNDSWKRLVNTCHVWAEESQHVQILTKGGKRDRVLPLTMVERLKELGIEDE